MLIPVFFSCETNNDLGIKYELDSDASVRFVEFVLPSTNIYLDSLRTDGENRILTGNHTDPLTGSVSAEGYFQFFYEEGPMPRAKETDGSTVDTLKIDSIIVTLESSTIIPQITSSFQEFRLHELQDTLESAAVYLSRLQQVPANEIGIFSNSINPALDTLYRVKLTDDFSQEFYSQLSEIAGNTQKNINTTTFKSLGLIPGASSESITSFDLTSDTSRMVIYSSPIDPEAKDTTYLTSFRFTGKNYTYLDRDRSGSSYDGIPENQNTSIEDRDFDISSGQTIIDPLFGLSTAFSLDSLNNFFLENPAILINSAITSFEFEEDLNRDTLINFMNFFRKNDDRIFGPAIVSNPFGNIVMSDDAYLSFESNPANGLRNDSRDQILLVSTLFYQQLYRQFLEGDSLAYLTPTNGSIIPIDEMVTISPTDVTLQRTIFRENGVKLRLYYTEAN